MTPNRLPGVIHDRHLGGARKVMGAPVDASGPGDADNSEKSKLVDVDGESGSRHRHNRGTNGTGFPAPAGHRVVGSGMNGP